MRRSGSIRSIALLCIALGTAIFPARRAIAQDEDAPPPATLTKAPKLVKFVQAPYPESEKAASKSASVELQIAISETGKVLDVAVTKSAGPAFDAAAVAAAKQFVFEPAEFDGKPSPVAITYRYDFKLEVTAAWPVVNFAGVVKDRFTKKPLPNVKVQVDDLPAKTTNDKGEFQFEDLKPGKHNVTLSGEGFTTVSTDETIEKDKRLDVKYSIEPKHEAAPGEEEVDMEIVVVAPKIKKEVVSTAIAATEAKKVAGTGGDTLKVVQNLPGVARAAFGSGALVVWGAAPNDTRIYVDGVRVPLLYHVGGLRSTINSDIVSRIDLAPGGYGPAYGGGLGGLVTVETRTLKNDKLHGYVASDVIDSSAMVEGPIDAKTRVAVAARKSYLTSTIKVFTSEDVSEFVPIPSYYDAQLKIERDLGRNESLTFLGLLSSDTLTRSVPNTDPAQVKSEETLSVFGRIALTYRKQLDDGSTIFVTPSFGRDHVRDVNRFGGTPTSLDAITTDFAVRTGWRAKIEKGVLFTVGLDVESALSDIDRFGAVTLPAREGDIHVFGQPPGDQVNSDSWSTKLGMIAPFFEADLSMFDDRLHIVPGARLAGYVVSGSRVTPIKGETPSIGFTREDTVLEPRINVRFSATKKLSLKAAFGVYHQLPMGEDLSAVFGNPTLGISRATHWLAGFGYKLTEKLFFESVGFYAKSSDLVARSEAQTPLLAQALVQEGIGRAYGGQALLRQDLGAGFFGWISYSLIRSERQDHPDTPWRLFDYDQTHVATLVASYDLGRGFEIGTRVRYASGFPRTKVVGSFYDARRDLYEPVFSTKQNGIRIPAFFQVDVRFAKRFEWKPVKLEVFLDVQNVSNRKNAEDIAYNYNYSNQANITGLPILPVIGARAEW
jgi:TonB family protein